MTQTLKKLRQQLKSKNTEITTTRKKLTDLSNQGYVLEQKIKKIKDAEAAKKLLVTHKADIPPAKGAFIAYKKAFIPVNDSYYGGIICGRPVIVKLEIPAKAARHINIKDHQGWKCRASKAKVLEMKTLNGEDVKEAISSHDRNFKYKVGATVVPRSFSKSTATCAGGIHFFMQRSRAVNY